MDAYQDIIEYHKNKSNSTGVLKIYGRTAFHRTALNSFHQTMKAKFLFEIGKYDDALALLHTLRKHQPYNPGLESMIGDIYIEKQNKSEALNWYKRAQNTQKHSASSSNLYAGNLSEKIEKLENKPRYNGYFSAISLEDYVKDKTILADYRNDESVISLFAQQYHYDHDKRTAEGNTKMVVHLLSEAGAKKWTESDFRR